jgi:F420-dependent oxidoreductase-like protein
MDHFYQLPMAGPPTLNMLECYALLAALAARTERVQLGALVTGVTYRNPAVLAKEVTTLDVISRGRAILGIGAAWFEQEHEGYGVNFPPAGERLDRLEEAVQICRAMFTQDVATFEGRHYRVKDALNNPRPIRPDGIPIMVGGGGEKRTLRIVAEHADICNLFGTPDEVRHKLDVLDAHCERAGRDPHAIGRTRLGTMFIGKTHEDAEAKLGAALAERGMDLAAMDDEARRAITGMFHVGGPDEIAAQAQALLDAGLDGLIFNLPDAHDLEPVARAGSVLKPLLAG